MILAAFFGLSALLALFALHDVPRISGSVAFIVTLAALTVAILR
ncbi:hypothetical protein [Streptomyces sp. NPDC000878]